MPESAEEKKARFALMTANARPLAERYKEPKDLPNWVKSAIMAREFGGLSLKQAAKKFNRSHKNLENICKTPAARAYLEKLRKIGDDDVAMAQAFWRSTALGMSMEYVVHLEASREAGDHAEVGRTLRHMMKLNQVERPDSHPTGDRVIVINMPPGVTLSSEIVMGDSSAEKVVEADVEADDDLS